MFYFEQGYSVGTLWEQYQNITKELLLCTTFDVTTINPLLIKKHQSATTLRKTKTDKADAKGIALFIAEEGFQPDLPISYHNQELKSLTRARFSAVQDRSALKNKVKRLVVLLFPELLGEFSDIFGSSAIALLKQYPSAAKLAACHCDTLAALLRKNSRGRFGRAKAEHLKQLANNSVGNHSAARVTELRMLLKRIELISDEVSEYDREIKAIMDKINSPLLSIPGISYTLGAIIVAEIGDISRFSSPKKLLAFAGLDLNFWPLLALSRAFTNLVNTSLRPAKWSRGARPSSAGHFCRQLGMFQTILRHLRCIVRRNPPKASLSLLYDPTLRKNLFVSFIPY